MLIPIESCKYRLPCGHCEKFDKLCTQYGSVSLTVSEATDAMTVEEFLERNKQVYNEENFELLKQFSSLNASDHAFNAPACEKCPNNPKNGGYGICNCTVPYYDNPIMCSTNATFTSTTKENG